MIQAALHLSRARRRRRLRQSPTHATSQLLLAELAVLGVVVSVIAAARPASAASRPPKLVLIKVNDLAAVGSRYGHDFRWIACGLGTAPPYATGIGKCKPGQVPIYANFKTFRQDVRSGLLHQGMTILFDQETWPWTPKREQAVPALYLKEAGQIAVAHHVTIIESVQAGTVSQEVALAAVSAQWASVVSIQSQIYDRNPRAFLAYVQQEVPAIRAINKKVPIIAGLATDAGAIPVTAALMVREYRISYQYVQDSG
jgi:hypothetical protein